MGSTVPFRSRSRLRLAAVSAAVILTVCAAIPARAVESAAPRAMIVESDTGSVLYAKGIDETFAPGNFTKLMTAAVVFDALAAGEIRDDTVYEISEHAWRTGGAPARVTTMFAAVHSQVAVADLLRGLVVDYANDAAIALAEGIAGGEDAFARRMNDTAERLGMRHSRFVNPTGYADPRAHTTLADIATLVDYLQSAHADRFPLYGQPDFEWNRIRQTNKTSFVKDTPGVDGMMLAYDEDARFGAVVSAVRDGKRVLVAGSGFKSGGDRDKEIHALLDAAYGEFTTVTLFPAGQAVGSVRVFGGTDLRVDVTGEGPIAVTLPNDQRDGFRARIAYEGPVKAPVAKGQRIARLEVRSGDRLYQSIPLVAAAAVPVGGLTDRARDGLAELLLGWW